MTISQIVSSQKAFFRSGSTRSLDQRIAGLKRLKQMMEEHEGLLCDAIRKDFGKPFIESFVTEIYTVLSEIDLHIKNVESWSAVETVQGSVVTFPSKNYIYKQPKGTVLIIGAWNYPVYLILMPLIGALSAGNTAVLKPSDMAPVTSAALRKLIESEFPAEWISVVEGAVSETQELLDQPFDHIFFTGSTKVGKVVMKAAARHLIPVTLELGGKSPAIVHRDADMEVAVKRIWWGKTINAGQTCVAPDYVLIEESRKEEFITHSKKVLETFFANGFKPGETYTQIVNRHHFERLLSLLGKSSVIAGGGYNRSDRIIEPALIDADWDSESMKDEIFGPLLPIVTYQDIREAADRLATRPAPLTLYLFTGSARVQQTIIQQVPFGGGCINDTISHLANYHLPFGGAGASGMGTYHGKFSFDTFSRNQAVLKKPVWPDPDLRYPPYNDSRLNWFKRLFT